MLDFILSWLENIVWST
jgi:hypothetical protein